MSFFEEIGNNIKSQFENIFKMKMVRKVPVIIRLDGKAFHTFTRNFDKPFDKILMKSMQETMQYLCANIQGCVFGYTQSDEISLILTDYKTPTSSAFFGYQVQKVCSVSASMCTLAFNRFFEKNVKNFIPDNKRAEGIMKAYKQSIKAGAMFDSRCFNVPKPFVYDVIMWRQMDASRNSVSMLAQAHFSQKQLSRKNRGQMMDMLILEKGINWNDLPTVCKRGSACYKTQYEKVGKDRDGNETKTMRSTWFVDTEMPILKNEESVKEYINKWL